MCIKIQDRVMHSISLLRFLIDYSIIAAYMKRHGEYTCVVCSLQLFLLYCLQA